MPTDSDFFYSIIHVTLLENQTLILKLNTKTFLSAAILTRHCQYIQVQIINFCLLSEQSSVPLYQSAQEQHLSLFNFLNKSF